MHLLDSAGLEWKFSMQTSLIRFISVIASGAMGTLNFKSELLDSFSTFTVIATEFFDY
jgi:hypothetical protein